MKKRRKILIALSFLYAAVTASCILYYIKPPAIPYPEATTGPDAEVLAETTPDAPAGTTLDAPAESTPDSPAESTPDSPAGPDAEVLAESTPDSPAGTTPDSPAESGAETSSPEGGSIAADSPAETDTSGEETASSLSVPFVCHSSLRLNIRDTPGMSGTIIGKIKPGEQGVILSVIDEEWVMVRFQNTTGYCAQRYLTFDLPESGTDGASGELNAPAPVSEGTSALTGDSPDPEDSLHGSGEEVLPESEEFITVLKGCYIRSTPDWHSSENILRVADAGTSYSRIPEKDTPDFYAVRLPGNSTAYISSYYAQPGADTSSIQ